MNDHENRAAFFQQRVGITRDLDRVRHVLERLERRDQVEALARERRLPEGFDAYAIAHALGRRFGRSRRRLDPDHVTKAFVQKRRQESTVARANVERVRAIGELLEQRTKKPAIGLGREGRLVCAYERCRAICLLQNLLVRRRRRVHDVAFRTFDHPVNQVLGELPR